MASLKFALALALFSAAAGLVARQDGKPVQHLAHGKHGKKAKHAGRHSDCWTSKPVSQKLMHAENRALRHSGSLLQKPGFGLNESGIEPYETVTKDGYFFTECTKDAMMTTADRHGDGKFNYKNIATVSVIWYDRIVPKEDQEAMTPKVCYLFCRTVPDAGFFGLSAGRKCYCTPYYTASESGSTTCDSPCEGEPTSMCGGMEKQSMYEMHMCNDVAKDIIKAETIGNAAKALCQKVHGPLGNESLQLELLGTAIKTRFGTNGDPLTSNTGQIGVQYTAELSRAWNAVDSMITDLNGLTNALGGMTVSTDAEFMTTAEDKIAATKALADKAEDICDDWLSYTVPTPNHTNSLEAYYPITYWSDGATNVSSTESGSTCMGDTAGKPEIVDSASECATICDSYVIPGPTKCIAFQFVALAGQGNLCVPLNTIETYAYYTKGSCPSEPAASVMCGAKFQLMTGFENRIKDKTAPDYVATTKYDRCI